MKKALFFLALFCFSGPVAAQSLSGGGSSAQAAGTTGCIQYNAGAGVLACLTGSVASGGDLALAGNLTFVTSGTNDIGSSGGNKPRNIYVSGSVLPNSVQAGSYVQAPTVVFTKFGGAASAPGGGFGELQLIAGTNAGTCKLVAYAGTSATPAVLADNIGAGC